MLNKLKSEAGKLGAQTLNSNPDKKSAASKKAAETRKKTNPNIFRKIGRIGGLNHWKKRRSNEF